MIKVEETTSERVLKKDFLRNKKLNRILNDENSSKQISERTVTSEKTSKNPQSEQLLQMKDSKFGEKDESQDHKGRKKQNHL